MFDCSQHVSNLNVRLSLVPFLENAYLRPYLVYFSENTHSSYEYLQLDTIW